MISHCDGQHSCRCWTFEQRWPGTSPVPSPIPCRDTVGCTVLGRQLTSWIVLMVLNDFQNRCNSKYCNQGLDSRGDGSGRQEVLEGLRRTDSAHYSWNPHETKRRKGWFCRGWTLLLEHANLDVYHLICLTWLERCKALLVLLLLEANSNLCMNITPIGALHSDLDKRAEPARFHVPTLLYWSKQGNLQ